jgi:hypothetical protein
MNNGLCIFCGSELEKNINVCKCLNCNLQWTLAEHKDNQNWAVRHIRLLESATQALQAENQALKEQIVGLIQQNVDLATKLDYLTKQLEAIFNKDLDGDGNVG